MNAPTDGPAARTLDTLHEEAAASGGEHILSVRSSERAAAKAPGRLSKALLRLMMRQVKVAATERLAEHFKLITLEGAALEGVVWSPGQKVQIAMGSAFVTRTYTPIEWNASTGRTCILACEHGEGPGSAWVRGVAPGDECDLFGPRGSIDLRQANGPVALFGDETSIGLGYALGHRDRTRSVAYHFEVGDPASAREVLAKLQIGRSAIFARQEDDGHIEAMEAAIPVLVAGGASFVLTGRARTVQRLRQSLKRHAVPGSRVFAKAYWAPGKIGLD